MDPGGDAGYRPSVAHPDSKVQVCTRARPKSYRSSLTSRVAQAIELLPDTQRWRIDICRTNLADAIRYIGPHRRSKAWTALQPEGYQRPGKAEATWQNGGGKSRFSGSRQKIVKRGIGGAIIACFAGIFGPNQPDFPAGVGIVGGRNRDHWNGSVPGWRNQSGQVRPAADKSKAVLSAGREMYGIESGCLQRRWNFTVERDNVDITRGCICRVPTIIGEQIPRGRPGPRAADSSHQTEDLVNGVIPVNYIGGDIEIAVVARFQAGRSALPNRARVGRSRALDPIRVSSGETPTAGPNRIIFSPSRRRVSVVALIKIIEDGATRVGRNKQEIVEKQKPIVLHCRATERRAKRIGSGEMQHHRRSTGQQSFVT